MKPLNLIIASFSFMPAAWSEVVEVYSCESRSGRIEWEDSSDDETTTFFTFHRIIKRIGSIDFGKSSLKDFVKRGVANRESTAQDPFFGPGINYLLKDQQGDFFIAFFEFARGHKAFDGRRMAINHATHFGEDAKVFLGSPYEGGSPYDKEVLKQLKALAVKQAEQAGAGQPATRPESKSEGGDKPQPKSEGRSR
jgi:hypothetical protein